MPEMAALRLRFEQLDRVISSTGAQRWGCNEAAEVRDLMTAVDTLLQRNVDHAASPLLVEGIERLEAAVKDDNTRQISPVKHSSTAKPCQASTTLHTCSQLASVGA